ncbi:hypothetical protein [Paenibacillus sedimenti]|uniref:Uncharacterized protein n=1 Tax=Paenibacillus sedimenti TaxID=2770274 RepID=A0A926QKL0_9BACL|nr:hypothetical protein [Paenibacillus sedimenti]MBD0382720.1 hypothetical protein [Paenibacillus sedimenti]
MIRNQTSSSLPLYAIIFGLIAILLNLFLIPIPLGFIFGIAAFICGFISYIRYGKWDGFILSLFSFLLILLWICSILIPLWVDPTLQIEWK